MEFTQSEKDQIKQLRTRYPDARSLTLPIMWMLQKREGYISDEAVYLIAEELAIPPIWVEEVRSWYTMFSTEKEGKYVLEICNNISCAMLGSQEIIDYISEKLNIKVGETTADGMFTLKTAECLGSCGTGPMMQVGDNYYEILDKAKVDQILEDLRKGKEHEQQPQEFPEYK
ncbi:NAD(P)H-dependent oxidoreductase subunit E [candidate division KSB1 bacterium]|nr:NAD(P)H-dependent oxidoreductase subunit E [candidate division KSB1 bacterium]